MVLLIENRLLTHPAFQHFQFILLLVETFQVTETSSEQIPVYGTCDHLVKDLPTPAVHT
jgi:hypothetical protein